MLNRVEKWFNRTTVWSYCRINLRETLKIWSFVPVGLLFVKTLQSFCAWSVEINHLCCNHQSPPLGAMNSPQQLLMWESTHGSQNSSIFINKSLKCMTSCSMFALCEWIQSCCFVVFCALGLIHAWLSCAWFKVSRVLWIFDTLILHSLLYTACWCVPCI